MNDEKQPNVNPTVTAITEIVKSVPIYTDTVQPAAIEVGKALQTVAKTVNIALAPIKALVWGYDQIEEFINTRVTEKLRNVREDDIVTPSPQLAGPAIEALRYTAHENHLRELFANLIATSMDRNTLNKAHPGYVDIIKNLTPDEAVLLTAFKSRKSYPLIHASIKRPNLDGTITAMTNFTHIYKEVSLINHIAMLPSYIDNLSRLGILTSPNGDYLTAPNIYDPLINDDCWIESKEKLAKDGCELVFTKGVIQLTAYGKHFVENVVIEK
ncbi:MAG: DUF4393 domain-containing protein [Sphingobacteriales bacterium]|nr:MAG: DUF4393 domain-containing protein [Sphingobacteriales bacterium]